MMIEMNTKVGQGEHDPGPLPGYATDESKMAFYTRRFIIPIRVLEAVVYVLVFLWAGWFVPHAGMEPVVIMIAGACFVLMLLLILKIDRNAANARIGFYHSILFISSVVLFFPAIASAGFFFWSVPFAFLTTDLFMMLLLSFKPAMCINLKGRKVVPFVFLLSLAGAGLGALTVPFAFPAYYLGLDRFLGFLVGYYFVSFLPTYFVMYATVEPLNKDVHRLADALRLNIEYSFRAFWAMQ
jgi:hypothetical protein